MMDSTAASLSHPAELAILVVDDDPNTRHFVAGALEDEGLAVEIAADGQQAVERARQRRPSLVVLDMAMPILDGHGVAAALRAAYGPGLPILMITADGHAAEKARQVGALAYLSKPFGINALLAEVRNGLAAGGAAP